MHELYQQLIIVMMLITVDPSNAVKVIVVNTRLNSSKVNSVRLLSYVVKLVFSYLRLKRLETQTSLLLPSQDLSHGSSLVLPVALQFYIRDWR